jgi:hypothetical protein
MHYEHGKVIKRDFKPGSVERSIDLQKGHTSRGNKKSADYFSYSATNEN